MALNSINTNIAAYFAQSNIGKANSMASSSIARLSSGDRIVQASDDVAAMSAGTSLRTNVTTLRMALINTSQGSSLLQVADGALSQVTDILQRQKAIAVQAGSGSLTASERGFLNQEFQNLVEEIDRLASQTNFNGVTLLDGTLFDVTKLEQNTQAATQATASVTLTQNVAAGELLEINHVAFTEGAAADFVLGATIAESVQNMANALNASTNVALSGNSYEAQGNTLVITSRGGGTVGQSTIIDIANSTGAFAAANVMVAGALTDAADTYLLQGGDDTGIGVGDTVGIGTAGDSIIGTQNQTRSQVSFQFANLTGANLTGIAGSTIVIPTGDANGGNTITFDIVAAGAAADQQDAEVANTIEETIDNIVDMLNNFDPSNDAVGNAGYDGFLMDQVTARREGRELIIESIDVGQLTTTMANDAVDAITTSLTAAQATITNGGLFNSAGTLSGVGTYGITNSDFTGTVQGFEVEYTGAANVVNISVEVGGRTYQAAGINVSTDQTFAAGSQVRLISAEGDYFDVDFLGATQSITVSDQSGANDLAARLDTAFSSLTFTQTRSVSSYLGAGDILTTDSESIGSLTGSSFELTLSDFSTAQIDDVRVTAPLSGQANGIIEFDINGVTYRSDADITDRMGSNAIFNFTSLEDPNDVLRFSTGDIAALGLTDNNGNAVNSILFDTATRASAVEQAFKDAFGIGQGGESIDFQVGVTTSDTLAIRIDSVATDSIYAGEAIDVLTKENAARASDVLDAAIDAVTSVRAEVGALQSRFDFAASNVESSIQNQDAARGVLLDTDVASESTAYATAQVQLQAGIAVLAQANLLPQNLLKLIG